MTIRSRCDSALDIRAVNILTRPAIAIANSQCYAPVMPDKELLPLRYILVDLAKDVAIGVAFVGITISLRFLFGFIEQGEIARRLVFVSDLMLLAVLTLVVLTNIFRLIYRLHISIRQALDNVQSHQQPPIRNDRVDFLSLLAGFLGLVVVFALMHQAASLGNPISKLLIYIAAFILGFEVVLMVAHKAKHWTIGSILSATHQGSGRNVYG
jgi:hypothetical protein